MTRLNGKRGVALLWTVILITIMTIISGTMVTYVLKEMRFSVNIEASARAYAAAKEGMDWALIHRDTYAASGKTVNFNNIDGLQTKATVVLSKKNPSPGVQYEITSTGVSGGVTREVVHTIKNSAPPSTPTLTSGDGVTPAPTGIAVTNNFKFQYSFWYTSGYGSYFPSYGLTDGNGTAQKILYMRLDTAAKTAQLCYKAGPASRVCGSTVMLDDPNTAADDTVMTADYGLKGEILYTKNASATLTISKRIIDGNNKEQFIDLGSSKLALDGQGTNPDPASANFLANIYYTYTTYYPSGSPYGDGENLFYQGYVFDNVRIFR